ncbi:MAG: DsbA family protein [Chloroflexi bacterium]|jgi:protein-disulfide isomerase|nr:DsbA family protein [Chloroflexota bacterium]
MQSRQAIQARRRQRQKQQRMTMVMVISGVVLILAALLMLPSIRLAMTPVGEIIHPELVERPLVDGSAMGDPNAPVVIHGYSDFGCGHCANFSEGTGLEIAETYVASGQVYFVDHSVGLLLGSEVSFQLAEAAYCAADQNKYWEFHDYIFANQLTIYSSTNVPVEKYVTAFAEAIELDMDAFSSCYKSNAHRDQVQQDQLDAVQAGINSTPSFTVNGELLIGNLPFADFQAAIETALSQ